MNTTQNPVTPGVDPNNPDQSVTCPFGENVTAQLAPADVTPTGSTAEPLDSTPEWTEQDADAQKFAGTVAPSSDGLSCNFQPAQADAGQVFVFQATAQNDPDGSTLTQQFVITVPSLDDTTLGGSFGTPVANASAK